MTINTDLLLEIREQITTHPETHDQDQFGRRTDCGTTYCIAGWAALLTSAPLIWTQPSMAEEDGVRGVVTHVGDQEEPDVYACRVMGLSDEEAGDLFYEFDNAEALSLLDALIEKGKNGS